MFDETIEGKLMLLEAKVKNLLAAYEEIKIELVITQEENAGLRNIIEKQNELLKNFNNQDKISKIVGTLELGGESTEELDSK